MKWAFEKPNVVTFGATGKALTYLHHEWPKLVRYLDDGRLEIDINRAENAIRPFVMGRKNWLFSNSVRGVKASANLYSLIETAKANQLEPYAYLRHLFTELPKATTVAAIEALLPATSNRITSPSAEQPCGSLTAYCIALRTGRRRGAHLSSPINKHENNHKFPFGDVTEGRAGV